MEDVRESQSTQNIKVEFIANSSTCNDKRYIVNEATENEELTNGREIHLPANSTLHSSQNNAERLDCAAAETEELEDTSSNSRQPCNSNGLGIPSGNHYLRNAILDEVLSEKKMALLWSPQVIKFLQDQQMAKRTNF